MKQRYIINMQDIDNLDNLQIEVAPFTIFTGDNNSGKSTVMNVVYGIFTLSKEIIKNGDKDSKEYSICMEYIKNLKETREGYIDSEVGNIFCNFFNMSLLKNKEDFFNKIFNVSIENNYKRFENSNIFISNYRIFPKVYISVDDFCDEILIEGDYVKIPSNLFEDEDYVLELICNKIIEDGFMDTNISNSIFIPSGRSTFLCYHDIFRTIKYQNLSTSDFIDRVENLECIEDGVYSSIYNFIERDIVKGVFTNDSYKCSLNGIEIPISMASDSIREIASLVLFLKSKERITSFFIEEVESHLDLKLQRSIVSALVRIINSGTGIFMSTNSSIILDQICNFILLNNLNRHKIEGFGYIINDVLNSNDVRIYEFNHSDNDRVFVNKLNVDYNGFKINMREEILEDILKENLQLKFEMFDNNGR